MPQSHPIRRLPAPAAPVIAPDRARAAIHALLAQHDLTTATPYHVACTLTPSAFTPEPLTTILRTLYQHDVYHAITDARPDLATWRQPPMPPRYWQGVPGITHAQGAILQLIDVMGLADRTPDQLAAAAPQALFEWCGLGDMLAIVYGGNPVAALRAVCPAIRPWHHAPVPRGYWQAPAATDRAIATIHQLLGELGWGGLSAQEVAARSSYDLFSRHGLGWMLVQVFDGSYLRALQAVYPPLRADDLAHYPQHYWQGPTGRRHAQAATRRMLTRLNITDAATAAEQVTATTFHAHGLRGMLRVIYADSPHAALADVFPDLPGWWMASVPKHYWEGPAGREHARAALCAMLADRGLTAATPEAIARQITPATFRQYNLGGMFSRVYHGSVHQALADLDMVQ